VRNNRKEGSKGKRRKKQSMNEKQRNTKWRRTQKSNKNN